VSVTVCLAAGQAKRPVPIVAAHPFAVADAVALVVLDLYELRWRVVGSAGQRGEHHVDV
jgi:hypothetical protein